MPDITLKCPVCGLKGSLSNKQTFEPLGMRDGHPVIKCSRCGTRVIYSLSYISRITGKPKIRQILTREEMPLEYMRH